MPVTLAALVGQSALALSALTGADALAREITWVHASELADPTPYLDGGELLLSLGMWLAPGAAPAATRARTAEYVERLVDAGVVGLGFGIGLQHAQVPGELVAAATAQGLPLIQVPERTAFVAIGRTVWEALAAEQHAEVTRTSMAQQDLTRAAVAAGAAGLVRRLAERLDGWALLLDAVGSLQYAAPRGAERQAAWLATELERFRDLSTPVSATLAVDGDQIAVQSLRIGRRTGGFLAVGSARRLTREQRTVLNTAVSLLTLMMDRTTALQTAEAHLRTTIFELLEDGEVGRAARLADRLWGGLPSAPLRVLLAAGSARCRDELAEALGRTGGPRSAGAGGERVFHAEIADHLVVVYPAGGPLRGRVLAAAAGSTGLTAGESSDLSTTELGRGRREAEQALAAGLRANRRFTSFSDIGATGLLSLLGGPTAAAFAESLLRPLITHDVTGRGDLIRSLATWLEHNGEWDAAAVALGVHRHTLRNRMRRVAELLGRDLDVAAVRAELWVGLRVLDATGATAVAPASSRRPAGPDGPDRRMVR